MVSGRFSHRLPRELVKGSRLFEIKPPPKIFDPAKTLMSYTTKPGNGSDGGEVSEDKIQAGKGGEGKKLDHQQLSPELRRKTTLSDKNQLMVDYANRKLIEVSRAREMLTKEGTKFSKNEETLANETEANKDSARLEAISFMLNEAKKSYRFQKLPIDAYAQGDENFKQTKLDRCEEYAKEHGMTVENYIQQVDANARQILSGNDTKICIRCFGAPYLLKILKDEFRTMHTTGMTTGGFDNYQDDLADRLAVEQLMHNQDPTKTAPDTYRVSAYVTNKKDGEGVGLFSEGRLSEWYGNSIAIILKDKAKKRAYAAFDDIIRHIHFIKENSKRHEIYQEGDTILKTMKPVPFLEANSDAFAWNMGPLRDGDPETWHRQDPLNFKKLEDIPSFYTEVHIARNEAGVSSNDSHKPLGGEEIERVVFLDKRLGLTDDRGRSDPQLLKNLMTELSERGIAWSVKQGLSLKDVFGDLTDVARKYSKDYEDAWPKLEALGSTYQEVSQYCRNYPNEIGKAFAVEELVRFQDHLHKVYKKIKNEELLEKSTNLEKESKDLEEDKKLLASIVTRCEKLKDVD